MFIGDIYNKSDVDKSIKNSKFVYNFSGISDIEVSKKNLLMLLKIM